jgi:hypothetical protein
MRRQLLRITLGLITALFSPQAFSLHCENPDQGATVSDSLQVDSQGPAETLFVVGTEEGIFSERFRVDLDRYYAQYPEADRRPLSNQLIYAYCTVLASATELRPEAKVALLKQFMDKIRDLDQQEASKLKLAVDSSQTDPQRVGGDWDCLSMGHLQATFLRIRVGPEGGLAIEYLDAKGNPRNPSLAGKVSEVHLEGTLLSYKIHFPGGRTSRVHLTIIDRDQLFGTYAWSGLSTELSYELRRRSGTEDPALTTDLHLPDANSTASNTR